MELKAQMELKALNTTENPVIKLDNVWKTYRMGEVEVHALQGINLSIMPGEFVAIQGASGSGKSTAMNLVGCLDVPTKGAIFLDGKDISAMNESRLAIIRGKKIGFVFQKFNLIPTLTTIQNVMLPLAFQGVPMNERSERATTTLTRVGLGDRLDHKPNQLSGGQQQRVAIARALVINPEVILADEPTGNLDSTSGQHIISMLQDLNQHGTTVVLVTHDNAIARIAKRILTLSDGKLVAR